MAKPAPRIWRRRSISFGLLLLLAAAGFGYATAASVTMKIVPYKGWPNNLQLSNGTVELIITLDVGPRIIRYGFVNGPNVFKEYERQMGRRDEPDWQIRGGHRLWHAPEDVKRTYALDNSPVKYEKLSESSVRLIQPVEAATGIQKELDITLNPASTRVTVVHRLRNRTMWDVELAPWALSVMAPGGAAIIPLPAKVPHPGSVPADQKPDLSGFVPNQTLILWPFTDLSDPRYRWGARYIVLQQDSRAKGPTKLGLALKMGWVAYLRDGYLFVKGIEHQAGRHYTDLGSNFETFTNQDMLEVESLGPLERIAPGRSIEHTERWWLLKGIPNDTSDAAIDSNIRPRVEGAMKQ